MKCPHCLSDNPEGVKFCGECGKSLTTEVICPQCSHSNPAGMKFCHECGYPLGRVTSARQEPQKITLSEPTSFANGRYQVKKFLGEGGKKKVYLAHDSVLDRDVAFALIKTETLDEAGRTRIIREAQAMGKLGDHPNIMSIFDFGDHEGQPFIVIPLIAGGDVEGLIKKAPDHKLPIDKAVEITKSVCKGLEFAHAKNVIHRDIKPGNIWLTETGLAKIGDFGLAIATNTTARLTLEGMMVGTVSYMPPEQAMGGQVTAKADLYSLGAMLYEMVTGRPPFIGDDSVAIIGQHINTPPVSPTWHRADLPPALETLIMQLLEKDPDMRPASAKIILQTLEAIEKGKAKTRTVEENTTPAENPLYKRVFVGREQELRQLQSAFDGAMSGQGALMMVLGEPGIGKTALVCEQLATWVALRGGRTLVGHCYEEGSLSLPYLAFVEAMRSYVLDRDSNDLRKELGSGATDVARIVSEIREKLDIKPKTSENPDEDRYRLMQSVTSFLTHAAAIKPIMVVLEDLHDADKGTLEMLTYLSRNLAGARLLIVGTYRDVEVDRTHPLSSALAELRRVSTFGRVILRGLNADEVKRMLDSITRENVPWGLAEAVHRQTEGNPLFVQEVVRYLNEEGLIKREAGQWKAKTGTPVEMSIPEGLRDVIGKRLSFLSKECNELLSIGSVIGREFSVDTLKAVANLAEDVFINVLKEAVHLAVLEERSQVGILRYRFTHAFFRQTLYEEMIAPQRLKLHQQVARALESLYANRLEEHAAELAEHFSQSTDSVDLKKAVAYGEMAAKRATDVYAYGEAARLLDQVLKVQKVLSPDDKVKICDLLLDLCDALLAVPDTKRILDIEGPLAFTLAESLKDNLRAVRVCNTALWAIGIGNTMGMVSSQYAEWAGRADRYAQPDTPERALADWAFGQMKCLAGDKKSGLKFVNRSLELARHLKNQETLYLAGFTFLQHNTTPQHITDIVNLAEELWKVRGIGVSTSCIGITLYFIGSTFLVVGKRQQAEEVFNELRARAKYTGHYFLSYLSIITDQLWALMNGRLDEVTALEEYLQSHSEEIGLNTFIFRSSTRASIHLGKVVEQPITGIALSRSVACLVLAHLGQREEALKIMEDVVLKRPGIGTMEDETGIITDALLLEASVLTNHHQAAEYLLNRYRNTGICTSGVHNMTCIPRHLGGAAALLGRYDEARQHYQEAIRVCAEMRFRPELALSRLQLAELLLEHYPAEKKEALADLDFSIKEFREMKMQPSLERALRHKEILKA